MDDVAARAGVSVTTVSHVLNDVPGKRVRPGTRLRVRQAADELGYVLNGVARSLRTRRSHLIAMIGTEVAVAPFGYSIIQGAQDAAARLGWLLITSNAGAEPAQIQALRHRQVEGFLYTPMYHREVALPELLQDESVVIVDGTSPDTAISSVAPDEFGGGRVATRELIRHGHTKIAFINDANDIPASHGRLRGTAPLWKKQA